MARICDFGRLITDAIVYKYPSLVVVKSYRDLEWGGSQWGKMGKNGEKWGKNFMGKAF